MRQFALEGIWSKRLSSKCLLVLLAVLRDRHSLLSRWLPLSLCWLDRLNLDTRHSADGVYWSAALLLRQIMVSCGLIAKGPFRTLLLLTCHRGNPSRGRTDHRLRWLRELRCLANLGQSWRHSSALLLECWFCYQPPCSFGRLLLGEGA